MKCENCGKNEANFVYITSAKPVLKSWAIHRGSLSRDRP